MKLIKLVFSAAAKKYQRLMHMHCWALENMEQNSVTKVETNENVFEDLLLKSRVEPSRTEGWSGVFHKPRLSPLEKVVSGMIHMCLHMVRMRCESNQAQTRK